MKNTIRMELDNRSFIAFISSRDVTEVGSLIMVFSIH